MSYEVIARRWRPQDFSGLIGQEHVTTTLLNALRAGRLPQAILLSGPRGTGKTSTARILAKALRCPNAVDFVPCNNCPECEAISISRSVDVSEFDGASNNGVDDIRQLIERVKYQPASGKYKVFIIDEVHMLSTSAFNALLKTLEEPPPHVYFIMATTEPHKLPETVKSRLQRYDFRPIPTRVISAHLQTICERDRIPFEPDALWIVARQGMGSMRDAQSLLDQVINFTGGQLKRDLVVSNLGLTDRALLNDLLAFVVSGSLSEVLSGLQKLHQSGGDPKLLLLDFMEQVRNTLLIKLSSNTALVDLPDSEREALAKLGGSVSVEDLHLFFDMALKGAQDLARTSDTLLVLEMVLLRMASAPRISGFSGVTVPPPVSRPVPGPVKVAAQPAAPTPAPAAPAPAATLPNEMRFKELVEKIKDVNGLVGAQLENCFVVKIDGKDVTLGISNKHKFLFDKMNQPDFKKKVLNYMNSFWGAGNQLHIVLAEPGEQAVSPKALAEKIQEDGKQAVRKSVEAHPLVVAAAEAFKTEIKSIKEIPAGKLQT